MEIRWMEAFVAVAEELHFGRAAARVHMAQSPLSQTIKKLEREVGTQLFERSTRSVQLTAAGQAFLPHARRVLEEVDAARRATRASADSVYGRVTIGFSGILNHLSLPPLTRAVRQRYPDIRLDLVGRVMTRDAVEQVISGRIDLAFIGLPVDVTQVQTRMIASEALGVVLPVDHRLAGQASIDLADLAHEDFVTTPISAGSALQELGQRACVDAGFQPRVVQEITDPYMILMLVAAGVGVALMTEGVAHYLPPGACYLPLAGAEVTMRHAIAWSPRHPSSARDAVLGLVTEVLDVPWATQ
ncbi:MAG: LysR family transcriptional regulator [Actinomycetales bacterium]